MIGAEWATPPPNSPITFDQAVAALQRSLTKEKRRRGRSDCAQMATLTSIANAFLCPCGRTKARITNAVANPVTTDPAGHWPPAGWSQVGHKTLDKYLLALQAL